MTIFTYGECAPDSFGLHPIQITTILPGQFIWSSGWNRPYWMTRIKRLIRFPLLSEASDDSDLVWNTRIEESFHDRGCLIKCDLELSGDVNQQPLLEGTFFKNTAEEICVIVRHDGVLRTFILFSPDESHVGHIDLRYPVRVFAQAKMTFKQI